jgi:hypothetical protein
MNGYKITTMKPIYHNGKFSHNILEDYVVHADSKEEANLSIKDKLKPEEVTCCKDLVLRVGAEWIYHTELLGKAIKRITYDYVLPEEVSNAS